jgi:hypothetical protein
MMMWPLEMMTNLTYTNDQSHPIPRFFCMGQTVWPTYGGVKKCSCSLVLGVLAFSVAFTRCIHRNHCIGIGQAANKQQPLNRRLDMLWRPRGQGRGRHTMSRCTACSAITTTMIRRGYGGYYLKATKFASFVVVVDDVVVDVVVVVDKFHSAALAT